jgi:hypothetical protein
MAVAPSSARPSKKSEWRSKSRSPKKPPVPLPNLRPKNVSDYFGARNSAAGGTFVLQWR